MSSRNNRLNRPIVFHRQTRALIFKGGPYRFPKSRLLIFRPLAGKPDWAKVPR